MSEKLKAKFLTVIWGERYIEEFARVSLPSYLTPSNLPTLAQSSNLEILIMTSEQSVEAFRKQPAFRKLEQICPVRFILIDDLITSGNYGVTLTLAYARGILDSGAEQTDTYFVFMNSDFVLAEGSLRTLAEKMVGGHRCIMAPSLRACSEPVLPILLDAVDHQTARLAMPPREMVQIAFDHLHPTVIGKTVTQKFANCTTHNQIYWQVDERTLLARYHLIFMLAIKPERPMGRINSYCDYGFVPELVPSGRFSILDDSDDFFMLELQPSGQEAQYVRCGVASVTEIANELSKWTTREHRRFAETDIVFRSGPLPQNFDDARKGAAAYMSKLRRLMTREPVNHAGHFYWYFGVLAWITLRRRDANQTPDFALTLPQELEWPLEAPEPQETSAPSPSMFSQYRLSLVSQWRHVWSRLSQFYLGLLGLVRSQLGTKPHVPIWRHGWTDGRLLLDWIASIKQRSHTRNLLVCSADSPLALTLTKELPFDVLQVGRLLANEEFGEWQRREGVDKRQYDNVLCHLSLANVQKTRRILERVKGLCCTDAFVGVYIDRDEGEFVFSDTPFQLAQHAHQILPAGWLGYTIKAKFAGGAVKRSLRGIEVRLISYLWPITWMRALMLPFVGIALSTVGACTALNNWRSKNGFSSPPAYCSSALLCMSRPASRPFEVQQSVLDEDQSLLAAEAQSR